MRWILIGAALSLSVVIVTTINSSNLALLDQSHVGPIKLDSALPASGAKLHLSATHLVHTPVVGPQDSVAVSQNQGRLPAVPATSMTEANYVPEDMAHSSRRIPVEEIFTATEERRVGDRIPVSEIFTGQSEIRVGERIPVDYLFSGEKVISVGEAIPVEFINSNSQEIRVGERIPPPDDGRLIIEAPGEAMGKRLITP